METLEQKLFRLSKESEQELKNIGLGDKLKNNITYTINYRAKRRLGQCCEKRYINISSWLLQVGSDSDIKNTIIHEILHTFDDAVGHGTKWQYYARYVNNRTNYHISRCGNSGKIMTNNGIDEEEQQRLMGYNYEIVCSKCGATWKQRKMSSSVLKGFKNNDRIHRKCGCKSFTITDLKTNKVICGG